MKKCYILLLSCFLGMTTKTNCMNSARQGFGSLFRRVMSRAMSTEVPRVVPQQPRMSWDEAVDKKVMIEIPKFNIWQGIKESRNVMDLMISKKYYREAYSKASEHGLMNADIWGFTKPFANIVHYLVSSSTKNEEVLDALRVAAKYGADLTLPDNDGRTPLENFNCSTSFLDEDIVKFFHNNGATGGKNLPDNTVKILQELEKAKKALEKAQKARDLYNERFKTKNEA